jgi:hypothetical protein
VDGVDPAASAAARALNRARWGTQATDRRIAELAARSADPTAEQREELRRLVEDGATDD